MDRNRCGIEDAAAEAKSPPHGGVDRNLHLRDHPDAEPRRPLTGAWIETGWCLLQNAEWAVAPSRGRGSKRAGDAVAPGDLDVAPSRGRGSKHLHLVGGEAADGRPLTGGVDRNTSTSSAGKLPMRRPLTGAWIETPAAPQRSRWVAVAPSRGRGSKLDGGRGNKTGPCRPLTGAWIETTRSCAPTASASAPAGRTGRADGSVPR